MQFKSIIISIIALVSFSIANAQQIAFPGAEGYGKYTTGGRGGKVIEVTNLNASGAGSLGAAISASGPRTVVFRVSGTITGNFSIKNDDITIAGQTAPGDGICIKGNISTGASNIIIRYIRVRWDPSKGANDALGGRYEKNIIFDHVSTSWSTDEVLTLYHNENTTVQWCIISQGCEKFENGVGIGHRFGGIWGNNYGSWHHNLLAHNDSRNPRWASGCGKNDYRNNVLYNWGYGGCYGAEAHQVNDRRNPPIEFSHINIIANYYKPGPATGSKSQIAAPSSRNGDADAGQWWVSDNFVEGSPAVTADNWKGLTKTSSAYKLNEPWNAMAINQESAQDAFIAVLDNSGCSFPMHDRVDTDIIDDVIHGTGKYGKNGIIDNPSDVGGWPELKSAIAPVDTDHDGMPDDWEDANGLDKNIADDRNTFSADGYTMLEVYLNSIEFNKPVRLKQVAKSGDTDAIITWTDSYIAEEGFIIEKSTDGINFDVIDSVGENTREYIDKDQVVDQNLKYRIVAFQNNFVTPYTIENVSLEILPVDSPIIAGETIQLQVVYNPENSTFKEVIWKLRPEDSSKAKIDATGKLTGLGAGTVQVSATTTDGTNLTAQIEVQIEIIEIISIELLPVDTLYVGDIVQLEAVINPENPTFKDLEWEIYPVDISVARISTFGKFYARGAGKVQVIATTKDGTNLTAQIDIVIDNKVGINDINTNQIEFKCYPNPSSGEVSLEWYCPEKSKVSIDIFDLNGKKLSNVLQETFKQGNYTTVWDGKDHYGRNVLPGLYLCIINLNGTKNIHSIIRN